MPSVTVAAILLGSGGETSTRKVALAALASLCRPVVVTAGVAARVRQELAGLPVDVVVGPTVRSGLETALASTPHLDAAVFVRCDQPLVTAGSIRKLLETFQRTRLLIAAAREGLPALFARGLFGELLGLRDANELKQIIREHSEQVAVVEMPEAEMDVREFAGSRPA
jgi:molybdenum cofactor cytidylyltransferase